MNVVSNQRNLQQNEPLPNLKWNSFRRSQTPDDHWCMRTSAVLLHLLLDIWRRVGKMMTCVCNRSLPHSKHARTRTTHSFGVVSALCNFEREREINSQLTYNYAWNIPIFFSLSFLLPEQNAFFFFHISSIHSMGFPYEQYKNDRYVSTYHPIQSFNLLWRIHSVCSASFRLTFFFIIAISICISTNLCLWWWCYALASVQLCKFIVVWISK